MIIAGLDCNVGFSGNDISDNEYWKEALSRILTYDPIVDIRELIYRKLEKLIERMERTLDFIDENPGDYNHVLCCRFTVLTPYFEDLAIDQKQITDSKVVINLYLALLKSDERLHDIADPVERANECHELLKGKDFKIDPIPRSQVEGYKAEAEQIRNVPEGDGIATFLRIEKETRDIALALNEFYSDFNGYIDQCIDYLRGK